MENHSLNRSITYKWSIFHSYVSYVRLAEGSTHPHRPSLIAETGGQLLHFVGPSGREEQDLSLRTHLSIGTLGDLGGKLVEVRHEKFKMWIYR